MVDVRIRPIVGGGCRMCGGVSYQADSTGPIHNCCLQAEDRGQARCPSCPRVAPKARIEDPETAHVAARRVWPKTGTRRRQVLDRLMAEVPGGWVDGYHLSTVEVGGSEGLRRLRELRDDLGWPIETRAHPDPSRSEFQYRIDPAIR